MSQVTVVGCGHMGSALIRALASGGTELTIWNRTAEKAHSLSPLGVTVAESFGSALEASLTTVVNISRYADAVPLLESERSKLADKTIIQLSSGKPQEARDLDAFVRAAGGSYIDGAIMGYPKQAGTPNLQILYSGNRAAFDAHKRTLEQLGGALFLGDDPGAASTLDLACLLPAVVMVVGLLQGVKICRNEHFPLDTYESFVKDMIPFMATDTLTKARQEDFATNPEKIECTVSLMAGATRLFAEYCRDVDIDAGMFEALVRLYDGGVAAGRGGHDWACSADLHPSP